MRSLTCWAAFLVMLLSCAAAANPIPDTVLKDMNDLARAYPAGLSEQEVVRLVDAMGRYHFRFWDPDVRDLVASEIDEYTPVLLACQGTTHAIDFGLHRWYRTVASEDQLAAMSAVLRRWLTEDIAKAPPDGAMQLEGPPSDVAEWIMAGRVKAAEVLSDYGDTTAAPLIQALLESPESSVSWTFDDRRGSLRWFLRQALRRLRDPGAVSVWSLASDGGIAFVQDLSTVDRVAFGYQGMSGRWPVQVDAQTLQRILPLITAVEPTAVEAKYNSLTSLRLYFPGGVYADFTLSDEPLLICLDNTRIEWPRQTLAAPSLWHELNAMRQSNYGGYQENW